MSAYRLTLSKTTILLRTLMVLLAQWVFTDLQAQSNLVKPQKIDAAVWAHFQNALKYEIPDSFYSYAKPTDTVPSEKRFYKYNDKHQPVRIDDYTLHPYGYVDMEKDLLTYDSVTGVLREKELYRPYKVHDDNLNIVMRLQQVTYYDFKGNRVLHYEYDYNDTSRFLTAADSLVYKYNKFSVPDTVDEYYFEFTKYAMQLKKRYIAEGEDSVGNPRQIIIYGYDPNFVLQPEIRFYELKWDKRCTDIYNVDTAIREYTASKLVDGKWENFLKRITYFNRQDKPDSMVAYRYDNNVMERYKKFVYTYDELPGNASLLGYMLIDGKWKLYLGDRRTLSIGDHGNGHYYLKILSQKFQFNKDTSGQWNDEPMQVDNL